MGDGQQVEKVGRGRRLGNQEEKELGGRGKELIL